MIPGSLSGTYSIIIRGIEIKQIQIHRVLELKENAGSNGGEVNA